MDDIIVSVQNLSKVYMLYNKPKDRLSAMLFSRFGKHYGNPFWALKDVSFEARRGQAIGILGRNGAGKSTLLQILAGTLQPSSGTVKMNGRVSALLELGSGFNAEYTGRENIFMNGAILGLNHQEMEARFDEIVAFADIGEFIDQPVKLYSSGMFARLAFSVAIMVEPEVLIVDEILSVGDARFARKSFTRMEEFRKAGHTILLVSHNPNQVSEFCDHAIILEKGRVFDQGEPYRLRGAYYDLLFGKGDEHITSESTSEETQVSGLSVEIPDIDQEFELNYPLDVGLFKKEDGFAWCVDLSDLPIESDSSEESHRSAFFVCEDDHPLGPGHSTHEVILGTGRGYFSHWGKQLLFSTSDNSDPRANGRKYSLKREDVLEDGNKAGESQERRAIRRTALKKLGLTRSFIDQGNTHQTRYGNGKAEFLDFGILDEHGNRVKNLVSGKKYTLFSRAVFYEDVHAVSTGFSINNIQGTELYGVNSGLQNKVVREIPKSCIVESRAFVTMCLTNGIYFLTIAIADPEAVECVQYDQWFDALQFEIGFRPGIHTTSIVNLNEEYVVNLL